MFVGRPGAWKVLHLGSTGPLCSAFLSVIIVDFRKSFDNKGALLIKAPVFLAKNNIAWEKGIMLWILHWDRLRPYLQKLFWQRKREFCFGRLRPYSEVLDHWKVPRHPSFLFKLKIINLSLSQTGEEGVRSLFTGQRERELHEQSLSLFLSLSLSLTGDKHTRILSVPHSSVSQHEWILY